MNKKEMYRHELHAAREHLNKIVDAPFLVPVHSEEWDIVTDIIEDLEALLIATKDE